MRNIRSRTAKWALAATCLLAAGSITQAATPQWTTGGEGNWTETTKWSTGSVPATGDTVYFRSNTAATTTLNISAPASGSFATVDIASYEGNNNTLAVGESGTLSAATINVGSLGTAAMTQAAGSQVTATTNFYVAKGSAAVSNTASYTMNGGSLSTGTTLIGYFGKGTFTQNDGTWNLTGNISLGGYTGATAANGQYNLVDGTLNVLNNAIQIGMASGTTGAVVQTGGTATVKSMIVGYTSGSIGSYSISDGTMNLTTSGQVQYGASITMTGGTLNFGTELLAGKSGNGTITVSGGYLGNNTGTLRMGQNTQATLKIIGSDAVIDPLKFTLDTAGVLSVYLDNGGLSAIQSGGTGGATTANGTLQAGFKGGAALLADKTATVISTTIAGTGTFAAGTPDTAMWTTSKDASGYYLSLADAANKADIAASYSGMQNAAINAGKGFVTLTDVDTSKALDIYLDVATGSGTLNELKAFLADSDFTVANAGYGDYDLKLSVAVPSASTQYFAWDLGEFKNGAASITSIGVGVVPEPTSIGLAMLGAAGLLLRRRSR